MTRPPVRLIDSADLSPTERALLEAGQNVAPVHYDVALGAAKFQASLHAITTAPATASAATSVATTAAKTATLTKLAVLLVPTLGAVAAYYAMRSAPPDSVPVRAPVATEQPVEAITPPIDQPSMDLAPRPAVTPEVPTVPREAHKPERTRNVRRASRATPDRTPINKQAGNTTTHVPSAAVTPVEPPTEAAAEPQEELAAVEEPTPAPKPAPTEAPDSINELRGIAAARVLIERDPAAALSLLQRLSRVHPNGYFVEEREALTVLALAANHDEDAARKHAARFLKAYPTSPFADRVRNAVR